MLIDFEVENFRSFREAKRFSFVASSIKELPENVFETPVAGLKLLKTAAVYGANASGKSNLLLAMHRLGTLLRSPLKASGRVRETYSPFLLGGSSPSGPSRFNVNFFVDEIPYEYCLSVQTAGIVAEEYLIAHPKGRPQEWFSRKNNEIEFRSPHLKGEKKTLKNVTTPSTPFLAVALAFEHAQLSVPGIWLRENLDSQFHGNETPGVASWSMEETAEELESDLAFRNWSDAIIRHADVGIQRIDVRQSVEIGPFFTPEIPTPDLPPLVWNAETNTYRSRPITMKTTRTKYEPFFIHAGADGTTVAFPLSLQSEGTRRLFSMLRPFYRVLRDGSIAIVDELSASLHPLLVRELVRLFHDPRTNPKNAQLLFSTHETSLLNNQLLRRDQVWLTEKSRAGETDLYSLHDIKLVRKDGAFEEGYLRGRYGAIPFFSSVEIPQIQDKKSCGETEIMA